MHLRILGVDQCLSSKKSKKVGLGNEGARQICDVYVVFSGAQAETRRPRKVAAHTLELVSKSDLVKPVIHTNYLTNTQRIESMLHLCLS